MTADGGRPRRSAGAVGGWVRAGPAVAVTGLLMLAGLGYTMAQSVGRLAVVEDDRGAFDAYATVLGGDPATTTGREFWVSLGWSLGVAGTATAVSAALALAVGVGLAGLPRRAADAGLGGLALTLVLPHLVWATALLVLLAPSGVLSRVAAAAGLVAAPAEFPVLVGDPHGIGVVLHYVTKETPFLVLATWPTLRLAAQRYATVAASLGAGPWHRLRHVLLPLVAPPLAAASLLVFAAVFGVFEVPALLGVSYPRALSVLVVDLFLDPDLRRRPEAAAVSVVMTVAVAGAAALAVVAGRTLRGPR
ncbi:MAG: ABC transporter permease subunit [Kineosporiaceae bacterium]